MESQGGGSWVLVEARLQGGAPWGFTLQGGLEHGEPLIISKVEEGGKAECLEQPLLVGDELIIINDVELTGYRQEAIALVKGSHKTLQLTVRREFDAGYIEEFVSSPPLLASLSPPSPSSLSSPSSSSPLQQAPLSPTHRRSFSAVQLRIKNRRSEPASRPHSWHSTKLSEGRQDSDPAAMDTMSSAWHHGYHASASTIDLTSGFDSGRGYLRKSPDQYSSRGSMESLDPPLSSQLHSGAPHQHHPMGHHSHSGSHPTYSSCHQLSSSRSSNSIDHLNSKRDSAYSSFSTSSSIPEYLASTPTFSPERSYSLETVPQRGGGGGDIQQAGMRNLQMAYDAQQSLAPDHEQQSSNEPSGSGGGRNSRERHGSVGGVVYHGGSSSSSSSGSSNSGGAASNRHSVGYFYGPGTGRSSYESLKGAPTPPRRSDSYAAIRNHERPNSWSSLEQARSLRSLQKGSWHHSSGPVASAKGSYGPEGQLHTVIEKSPESSPTTKPRQGGGLPQPLSPTGTTSNPADFAPQSSRLIPPPNAFPALNPEPNYAQAQGSNPNPGASRVHPAMVKDNNRQQQSGVGGREDGAPDGGRDEWTTAENGYPFNPYSTNASAHPRTQSQATDRRHLEESNFGPFRPHMKSLGGEVEIQMELQRMQKGPHSRSVQGSQPPVHTSQGPQNPAYQEQKHFQQLHTSSDFQPLPSQERSDAYIPAQSWGDRRRSLDQSSNHSEPVSQSRQAQGQVPPSHSAAHSQTKPFPTTHPSSRHLSESAALQYQPWDPRELDKDREHPLTRLENALAEVQHYPSPDAVDTAGIHDCDSFIESSKGPVRSLSVLEKVSRFERREHSGKQRSLSTSTSHHKAPHLRGCRSPCGAEDLRHMLERSAKGSKAQRTMSYRGGSSEHMKNRTPADPSLALQRSRSSFHVNNDGESSSKDFPWRQEIQEILGPAQDMPSNRSYRDTLKDAQSKVLMSTSFRRKDLNSKNRSPPPMAPPTGSSSSSQQPPPPPPVVSPKQPSQEKKGPKTMPKPTGVVITAQTTIAPPVLSPHAPKQRHVVCPDVQGQTPPALPSVPPVGPPALIRICGRKRLTADQKKRSFSEPENMNEVGVSDAETVAFFLHGGETSVADRRKMFELAASRVGGGALQNATSRPDLRQVQQDALAEYMERKRGVRKEDGGHRTGTRPRSAFFVPESSHSDTFSLSSASSLLSLQDSGLERNLTSSNSSEVDRQMHQSNLFYPGKVTSPRPPAQQPQSSPPGSSLSVRTHMDSIPGPVIRKPSSSPNRHQSLGQEWQGAVPQSGPGLPQHIKGALQRVAPAQHSGKSASAENLLERPQENQASPQHHRSRSSPTAERLNQDLVGGDVRMFGVFISEPGRPALAADRPSDLHHPSGVHFSPQPSHDSVGAFQPIAAFQDSLSPSPRKERSRTNERQRAQSTSTLAASVGLPCPFSPLGGQDNWQTNDRLNLANLDAIAFPLTGELDDGEQSDAMVKDNVEVTDRQTRHSLSDASILEDGVKETYRSRAFSLEGRRVQATTIPQEQPQPVFVPPPPPSPPPLLHPSVQPRLSSLRISESALLDSEPQHRPTVTPLEDLDEVFLQNPSVPQTLRETVIIEDFPPPPSPPPPPFSPPPPPPPHHPVALEDATEQQTVESPEFLNGSIIPEANPSQQSSPPISGTSISSPPEPNPVPAASNTSNSAPDVLTVEYQLLPKREKTSEEQRVEALARQLVLRDPSLSSLLDTWEGKSTVEIMEDIFPNCKPSTKLQWQPSGSSTQVDGRIQDGFCDPALTPDEGKETNLDEEHKDLIARKVELCECLRSSMAALRREKEVLYEDQKRHQSLGASMETVVQEHLKANERDKYSMFIGDLDRIVNLLLSLCSRLSRIDKRLLMLQRGKLMAEDTTEERESLHHKRSQLLRQTEDARELKENLDRRQRSVHAILSGYLSPSQLSDYRHYVSTKPSFLIRHRQLDDLIRQEEEQLRRLAETLPTDLAEAHGWSAVRTFWGPAQCSSLLPPLPSLPTLPAFPARPTTVTSL